MTTSVIQPTPTRSSTASCTTPIASISTATAYAERRPEMLDIGP